jgi:hypothetical protein
MTGSVTRILLIEKLESSERNASFSARCHAGVLHVGDSLRMAIDPEGTRHQVNVRCTGIRLSGSLLVDELETNYGGLVTLEGTGVSALSSDWTLCSE